MSSPLALTAVAALAAASQFAKRGSRSKLSEADKDRIVELVRSGRVGEARELSASLGQERLDLSGANLYRANLTGANLTGANLTEAILHRANLTGANLAEADLHRATLYRANLTGADLSEADLTEVGFVQKAIGINLGHDRVFKGTPDGYRIQRSRLSGRDYGLVRAGG